MKTTRVLTVSFIVNAMLSIIKIVAGIVSNYSSLVADGVHSISDLTTDLVAIIGDKLAHKPADLKHPFGHGKIEYVTSLGISIVMIFLGISLITNSFEHQSSIPNMIVMLVSLFTIISKYLLATFIYNRGVKYKNNILIASGKESKADVLSSLFVLVSIIIIQFAPKVPFLIYIDIVGTILIAFMIIKTGYSVLMDNLSTIIGEQIYDDSYLNDIKNIVLKEKIIEDVKDLYILKEGPYYKLLANVIMDDKVSLKKAHEAIDRVEGNLKKYDDKITYVFIHMEPKN